MTEDEAKTKVCHRTLNLLAMQNEFHSMEILPQKCLASECMAWRARSTTRDSEGRLRTAAPMSGFCGLAGAT